MEHGAEVNLQHEWSGRGTALMFSATQGHVSVIERLIALGAEVDAENIGGATPLILAARDGHTAAVAALLAAGGSIDHLTHQRMSALAHAAKNGHSDCGLALLDAGASATVVNADHKTVRQLAREGGAVRLLERLPVLKPPPRSG